MAREYARIKTSIWSDPEFRALPIDAQWLYHLIIEQPEISLCGVIRPALARWSDFAPDMTIGRVKKAVGTLSTKNYILSDIAKDELLIRSFVRHDINLKSPNVIVGLSNAFANTHSEVLRCTVICELAKATDQGLMEQLPEGLEQGFRNRLANPFVKAWENGKGNR